MTAPSTPAGGGADPSCCMLHGCDSPERCAAEQFCGAYLDDLRSDDPIDADADDLLVLRGWSGLPGEAEATEHGLTVLPMWRFHEAVARLAARGHVVTSITGAILGSSPSGRAHLASHPQGPAPAAKEGADDAAPGRGRA